MKNRSHIFAHNLNKTKIKNDWAVGGSINSGVGIESIYLDLSINTIHKGW